MLGDQGGEARPLEEEAKSVLTSLRPRGYCAASHTAKNSNSRSPSELQRPPGLMNSAGRKAGEAGCPPPLASAAGAQHLQRGHQDFPEPTGDGNTPGLTWYLAWGYRPPQRPAQCLPPPRPEGRNGRGSWDATTPKQLQRRRHLGIT